MEGKAYKEWEDDDLLFDVELLLMLPPSHHRSN